MLHELARIALLADLTLILSWRSASQSLSLIPISLIFSTRTREKRLYTTLKKTGMGLGTRLAFTTASLSLSLNFIALCSYEEAARYLETYKAYENKPPDLIMERIDSDSSSRVRIIA